MTFLLDFKAAKQWHRTLMLKQIFIDALFAILILTWKTDMEKDIFKNIFLKTSDVKAVIMAGC